jgi:hypothetical protein
MGLEDRIPPRAYSFHAGQKVKWAIGRGQVHKVYRLGTLCVREVQTYRLYDPDGVLQGRFKSNIDMNLFPDYGDDEEDLV